MPIWKLNAIQVLAIACFGAAMGGWLKKKVPVLDRFSVPSPVAGGLVFALLTLLLRDRVVNFEMDMALRDICMVAFFTTIGLGASARLLRQGGLQVLWFFGLATLGVVLQNALGVGLAVLLGHNPLLGLICGSVSMTGGPATALAFGSMFEQMGMAGAPTVALAAAMFGIVAGGLAGGPMGASLIRRYRLVSPAVKVRAAHASPEGDATGAAEAKPASESDTGYQVLFNTVVTIAVAMGIGTLISAAIQRTGLVLPAYVGAMFAAGILRNLDDRFGFLHISPRHVEALGTISLQIFIVMALLTLELWELAHLALPFLAILAFQVVLVWLLARALVYRAMGRDFDAAVMAGGYCGFGLGTTANAVACMDVLVEKFGSAPRAYLVVPLVGAFLIDFTNAMVITLTANFLR